MSRLTQIRIAQQARMVARTMRAGADTESEVDDAALRSIGESYTHLAGGGQFLSRRAAEEFGGDRDD